MSLLTIIVTEDYNIRDPELTETGHAQVQELRANLINHPVAQNAGLIVTSPMIRTMQTAMGSLDWLIDSGVKIEADAGWQGMQHAIPLLTKLLCAARKGNKGPCAFELIISPHPQHYWPLPSRKNKRKQERTG